MTRSNVFARVSLSVSVSWIAQNYEWMLIGCFGEVGYGHKKSDLDPNNIADVVIQNVSQKSHDCYITMNVRDVQLCSECSSSCDFSQNVPKLDPENTHHE